MMDYLNDNKKLIKDAFKQNPNLFVELISKYYPLNNEKLNLYINFVDWNLISKNEKIKTQYDTLSQYIEKLNFNLKVKIYIKKYGSIMALKKIILEDDNEWNDIWINLSNSENLEWSIHLIKEFETKWNWYQLSNNKFLPWSAELIKCFEDKWDWDILSGYKDWGQNKNWVFFYKLNEIPWTFEIIEKFEDKWNWDTISSNGNYYYTSNNRSSSFENFPWSTELIERFEKKINWRLLSQNPKLLWSEELIDKYINKWNWDNLCNNISFPWSRKLIYKYYKYVEKPFEWTIENWDDLGHKGVPGRFLNPAWSGLSYNTNIKWDFEFIEEFENILNFKYVLSKKTDLPWSETLIDKYINKWDWRYLTSNSGIKWSESLIEKYKEKIHFRYLYNTYENTNIHTLNFNYGFICLSASNSVKWEINLIEKYIEEWDWCLLSSNKSLPWNENLINYFNTKWDWNELCKNTEIEWTEVLLNKYQEKLNWVELSKREKLPWEKNILEKYNYKWNWEELSNNKYVDFQVKNIIINIDKIKISENVWNTLKSYIDEKIVIELFEEIKTGKILFDKN